MAMKTEVALIVSLMFACCAQIPAARGAQDLSQAYRFSAYLDRERMYQLFWNFDLEAETISFAVQVKTSGWVGFGVSPNGQMPGSDVVIGWVDRNGDTFFSDRYAEDRIPPAVDSSQDWFLVRSEEENGTTVLEFTRNLTTCDNKDLDIKMDTARVVWSWHSSDPVDTATIPKHQFKGSTSLNLLGGSNEDFVDPPDHDSFVINNVNLTIPNNSDTTYWCSVHRLPQEIRERERFIYKISPYVAEGNQHTHHLLVVLCTSIDGEEEGSSTNCDSASINVNICKGESLLAAWAVGGTDFIFPDGIAVPIGGPNSPNYVLLEVHYDNPNFDSGVVDSSGVEFFYTDIEPTHHAGVLVVGHVLTPLMVIPPRADNFAVDVLCSSQCTQKFLPPEGITVFANSLHTHLKGHGAILQHFRQNECGVIEELPPIEKNLKYDFNFQQFNRVPEVKVLPGDILSVKCFYQSKDEDTQLTFGGEGTQDEMCFTFAYYYPLTELAACISTIVSSSFTAFADKHIELLDHQTFYHGLNTENETLIADILGKVEWTTQAVQDLEDSLMESTDILGICVSSQADGDNRVPFHQTSHVQTQCPYQASDKCSTTEHEPLSCCEKLGSGASSTAASASFLVAFATVASLLW